MYPAPPVTRIWLLLSMCFTSPLLQTLLRGGLRRQPNAIRVLKPSTCHSDAPRDPQQQIVVPPVIGIDNEALENRDDQRSKDCDVSPLPWRRQEDIARAVDGGREDQCRVKNPTQPAA